MHSFPKQDWSPAYFWAKICDDLQIFDFSEGVTGSCMHNYSNFYQDIPYMKWNPTYRITKIKNEQGPIIYGPWLVGTENPWLPDHECNNEKQKTLCSGVYFWRWTDFLKSWMTRPPVFWRNSFSVWWGSFSWIVNHWSYISIAE